MYGYYGMERDKVREKERVDGTVCNINRREEKRVLIECMIESKTITSCNIMCGWYYTGMEREREREKRERER